MLYHVAHFLELFTFRGHSARDLVLIASEDEQVDLFCSAGPCEKAALALTNPVKKL